MPTKERMVDKTFEEKWWLDSKKLEGDKKNEKKEKIKTIDLLLPKVLKKWLYTRWCWKHLKCLFKTPPNQYGHPKWPKYHGP